MILQWISSLGRWKIFVFVLVLLGVALGSIFVYRDYKQRKLFNAMSAKAYTIELIFSQNGKELNKTQDGLVALPGLPIEVTAKKKRGAETIAINDSDIAYYVTNQEIVVKRGNNTYIPVKEGEFIFSGRYLINNELIANQEVQQKIVISYKPLK